MLKPLREQCISEIVDQINCTLGLNILNMCNHDKMKILLNYSHLQSDPYSEQDLTKIAPIKFMCRRLVNSIHVSRLNSLSSIGKSKQRAGNRLIYRKKFLVLYTESYVCVNIQCGGFIWGIIFKLVDLLFESMDGSS